MNPILLNKDEMIAAMMKQETQRRFLTEEELLEYGNFAWEKGRKTAADIQAETGKMRLEEIVKDLKLAVAEEEENRFNFSEYQVSSGKIVLFQNTIKEKFIDKERKYLLTDEYDVIKQLFLAHELFHHLEYTRKEVGITARQRQAVKFALGRFQWKTGLCILSEIGAHSFAQAMVGDDIIRVNREIRMPISGKEDTAHESA